MPAFNQRIAKALATRKQQGLSRCLRSIDGGNQAQLVFNEAVFANFSSNDYLGLANDKELSFAWQKGIELYGNGSGASPLVTGFSPAHQNLESALCDWLGYPRAVLFNSGFSANQAMLFSLLEKGDLLLQDKLNHASLMEAGALSPATMKRFLHNDPQSLSKLLTEEALVVTEGVFSMDGDLAPLADLNAVCEGKAWLAVDDAHGIGVLGEQGSGSCSHANVRPDLLVVTFGKAFGLSGAAILCSEEVGDYLTQFARHHVYSTAMPPSQAYALTHAVGMIQSQDWRREKLAELVGWESVAAYEARATFRSDGSVPMGSASNDEGWKMAAQVRLDWAVRELTDAYRRRGHIHSTSNPLEPSANGAARFNIARYGVGPSDYDSMAFTGDLPLPEYAPVRDIIAVLEQTYCRNIGFEIMQVEDDVERQWLLHRIESTCAMASTDAVVWRWLFKKVTQAALFEEFLHRKFVGAKRFSLEGVESLIPLLQVIIDQAALSGVDEMVLGMAHRGRLSVLVNLLGLPLTDILQMFRDTDAVTQLGSGDVKYHLGQSRDVQCRHGARMHMSMCFNPSHLEFVDPVVLGRVRAKMHRKGDTEGHSILPICMHGDAAVIGQGVVAETLNMSQLEGYKVGGSIHVVVNNQIGFTTESFDSRSSRYCTDVAKLLGAPVFHVNAEDLNAVVFAAQLAVEYRQTFGRDVFIDLIGFRRYGHNEGDEPRFTQPMMYSIIDKKPSVRLKVRDELVRQGILTAEEDEKLVAEVTKAMDASLDEAHALEEHPKPSSMKGIWAKYTGAPNADVEEPETGVAKETLKEHLQALSTTPEGFNTIRKIKRVLSHRVDIADEKKPVDWAAAEHLAFSTLLADGTPVRASGQDVQRGTFTHRHGVLTDAATGARYMPLRQFAARPDDIELVNSPLSEAAVLGFDWGYSLDKPDGLTIWEAQFGDFANGAQVIIDQFIASSEDKWSRLSGLVMLLPHGFEGQGPEHSSARLERFLQLSAEENWQVCNPTTPAQIFHLLRRQVVRSWRKPLVIMSPKSLLRHPRVVSSLDDLATGKWQKIIPDSRENPSSTKRVLLCSGRVYYDLEEEREKQEANDVAILRFEQLYPLENEEIEQALDAYKGAEFFWVQDEPWNMGPWLHIQARLRETLGRDFEIYCVARSASASPATGSKAAHLYEQERLLEIAFGAVDEDSLDAVRKMFV